MPRFSIRWSHQSNSLQNQHNFCKTNWLASMQCQQLIPHLLFFMTIIEIRAKLALINRKYIPQWVDFSEIWSGHQFKDNFSHELRLSFFRFKLMENLFCDFVEIIKSFDNLHTPFEKMLYCRQQSKSKVSDFVDLLAGIVA